MFEKLIIRGIHIELAINQERNVIYVTLLSDDALTDNDIFDCISEYIITCLEKHDLQVKH